MTSVIQSDPEPASHEPALRGYRIVYRECEKNFCPGCGGTHWWLGRMSAECCSCGTAIPYAGVTISGIVRHVRCVTGSTGAEHD